MAPKRISVTTSDPLESQLLADVFDVKGDLGIEDSSEDAYLVRLISSASADAATYCGRVFMQETIDDTFYLNDAAVNPLVLSRFPVASIESVTVDGTVVDAAEYTFEAGTGFLYRLDELTGGIVDWTGTVIVVSFTGGYETVPSDLEAAVISLIKGRRAARRRDPSVRSERVPDVMEVTYWVSGPGEGDLPADIRGVFDRYRVARL